MRKKRTTTQRKAGNESEKEAEEIWTPNTTTRTYPKDSSPTPKGSSISNPSFYAPAVQNANSFNQSNGKVTERSAGEDDWQPGHGFRGEDSSSGLTNLSVGSSPVCLRGGAVREKKVNFTEDENDEAFGSSTGSPPSRRPCNARRTIDKTTLNADVAAWFASSKLRVGSHLSEADRRQILRVLYTWRDIFLDDVRQLDATDLVCHAIPTRSGSRPYRAREPLYTPREIEWQQINIPKMLEAGIITYTSSPWSAKSRFVIKKNGDLRPVHQFCALNDATIKSNYPMRRVEPILNNLMQPRFKLYWWADASKGFFAVPMFPPHAYKTGFSCYLGQFCYLRMAQGLCGAPHTFAQLKDYVGGPIP